MLRRAAGYDELIEGSLGAHEAVAMSAVVGAPDERRGQVPKAFVVLRAGHEPSGELRAHVRSRLDPHEVPREIVFVEDPTADHHRQDHAASTTEHLTPTCADTDDRRDLGAVLELS